MINLKQVTKAFRTTSGEVRALDEVSLQIESGEFVAIRGPSGCGKSTLLSLIGGLATPTSGEVEVAGENLAEMSSAARARFRAAKIGFVFQMFHLLPYLSVQDNILLSARPEQLEQDRAYANELIEKFELNDRRNHVPGQLSAGERQRTAMARALITRPAILLADEPTGNLDPINASIVLDLMAGFRDDGGTVVLVTHDDKASDRAQRLVEMEGGHIK